MNAQVTRDWGAVLAGSGAVVMIGLAGALAYEAFALKTGRKPISVFVWEWTRSKPTAAILFAHFLGWLLGHLFWH